MKAGVIFTGSGPILILTTFSSFTGDDIASKLAQKGIKKFIVFEVELDVCKKRYGQHFDEIAKDVGVTDDLRILDYNGHNVFYLFSFNELGKPEFKEYPA